MLEIGQEWVLYTTPFRLKEVATAPAGGEIIPNVVSLYAKDNGSGVSSLCYKTDAGTEICLPVTGSIITGTGVAGRVAFWDSVNSLSSDADFTFATDTLTATKIIAPTSITISAFTAGSVVFAGTAGLLSQANANFFWDDSNKRLGIGITAPLNDLHVTYSSTLTTRGIVSQNSVVDVTSAVFAGRKIRGTSTTLSSGDSIVDFQGEGWDGSAFARGAIVRMATTEAWTGSAHGTDMRLFTTPTGSTSLTERFRVGPAGQWGIGGATYGSSGNVFTSGGASAAPTWSAIPTQTSTLLDGSVHTDTLAGSVTRGDVIVGNSTPKWARVAKGSAGAFLRGDGTDTMWSTLILPNAATANRIAYASATNTYGESANLAYDGTDFLLGSGTRARMSGQNRFRYLNSAALVSNSTNQAIATVTNTALAFDTESFDTDTLHDTVTNNSRLTAKLAGKYLVYGMTRWAPSAAGSIRAQFFRLNGTTYLDQVEVQLPLFVATNYHLNGMILVSLAANDYLELMVYQDTGGNLNVESQFTQFGMYYIGE